MTTKLKISAEYKSLLTPLSTQEYEGLKQSIMSKGQFLPIITNEDGVILDGHNRYRVCEELGIEPLVKKVSLNKNEEIAYAISVNANRRHLNPITMVILASRKYGDGLGHLGIVDSGHYRVHSLDLSSGVLNALVLSGVFGISPDGTPALQAYSRFPDALTFGPDGS